MSTPVLGGDGESFCVDGAMFAKVCSMCNGEIDISTDEKTCTVKGAGRTKLPIINEKIPAYNHVSGKTAEIPAENIATCYSGVSYAIAADQTRIQLTGILTETDTDSVMMTAIDGFQMSCETAGASAEKIEVIIPGAFMKLLSQSTVAGEKVTLRTDGKRVEAVTDGMMLNCGLLHGDFPPAEKILPKDFKTVCLVNADELRNALKCGSVVNNKQNLVKLEVGETSIKVMNNSEEADFEADVNCQTQGSPLKIAFNIKYLLNTINSINAENIELMFGTSVSPCVAKGQDMTGTRLVLPVRVMG
jgi:DNA polymerase-3 subunit beta